MAKVVVSFFLGWRRERGARALEERMNSSKPSSAAPAEGRSEEVGVEVVVPTIATESS